MEPFTHHMIKQTKDGIEVVLYLNEEMMEFSAELGILERETKQTIEEKALSYIEKKLPNLNVKAAKIMAGAILLSSIGFAGFTPKKAAAAKIQPTVSQKVNRTSYTVQPGDTLSEIAKKYGTTVEAIQGANHLTTDLIRAGDLLMIPNGLAPLPSQPASQTENTHLVSGGESLWTIASKYGTTVEAIKQQNNLTSDLLQIGQNLTIPGTAASPSSVQAVSSGTAYEVSSGDTLSGIAKKYGTTVEAIKTSNGLTSDFIRVGQRLTISGTAASPSAGQTEQTGTSYQVSAGDTLSGIAKQYGTTVEAIKQHNGLTSDFLAIGQTLTVPNRTAAVPAPTANTASSIIDQEEIEWLAKMIYCEARGESMEGQIAVGAVILNRMESDQFPNSVKEVVLEKNNGYYQFSPAASGVIYSAVPNDESMEAAIRAANGEDPTNGSLYFFNPDKTSSIWLRSKPVSTVIGNHVFAF
ncbi:LysM peptidoglycan-binding domain-containing protein [Bacillus taeanensis]|uniref:Cell wall hydrolase n=1 Tax=Bacillus taeanensis TaxID=273032 RepID=A0A366XZU7_9BACI|nr:LysM peptidoglycan-binding domain-containing protein [Bacillus taeanensis]RBW71126.1 cell wall hydrolase [Bacillus taeanensis]